MSRRKQDLKVEGKRRRASGEGSNSKRFAFVRMPDGREARIPAAKDAGTFICLATPDGGWPDRAEITLLYDVTHLVEGSTFRIKEMRPGHGMGQTKTVRVIETDFEIEQHEGCYGQAKRALLCVPVLSGKEANELSADDLEVN